MNSPAPSTDTPLPWASWATVAGLATLVGLAYSNSFHSGFVLDNHVIVESDPRIRAATWDNISLIFTEDYWYPTAVGGLYRPLTTLSLLFDYTICGYANNPANYHWINLGFHLLNAILLYFLTLQIAKRFWVAVGAACLFATHPIATEAVTSIVGRSDLFATSAVLAGTLIYIRCKSEVGWRKCWWIANLGVIAMLGMLSKENAVMIAGIILLFAILYQLQWDTIRRQGIFRATCDWLLHGYLAIIPMMVCFFFIRYWMLKHHGPSSMAWVDNSLRAADFVSSRLTAIKIIGHELWLLFCPVHLSCDYAFNAIPNCSWRLSHWRDWSAVAVLVGLIIAAMAIRKRFLQGAKAEVFFAGWFCITLLPTSNLLFLIDSNFAERFVYMPLIGFAGWIVLLFDSWTSRYRPSTIAMALLPVVCLFGWRTYQRNFDWRNNLTIWTSAVQVCPESCRAQRTLAWAIQQLDPQHTDFDTIIPIAEKAVSIVQHLPDQQGDATSYLNLGNFLGMKAERLAASNVPETNAQGDESRRLYERSIEALERARKIGEAFRARHVRNLIAYGRDPDDIPVVGPQDAYQSLAAIYSRVGRFEEAAQDLRKLQAVNPKSPLVYRALPDLLMRLEKPEQAVVVLIQSTLIGLQNDSTIPRLVAIYEQRNTESTPAFVTSENQISLNLENPIVRGDVDTAFARMIEFSLRNKDMVSAERGREAAKNAGCRLEPIDELFRQLGPKNRAWRIKK
jgi:protein O-mannosyl-transferase